MQSKSRWTVGQVQIYPLVELDAGRIIQEVIEPATPQAILNYPWLVPSYADLRGNLRAVVQAFLVLSEGRYILIDSCNGNGKIRGDVPEWSNLRTPFIRSLEQICEIEEVCTVVCTHIHMDHVGWNTTMGSDGWTPTFPKAEYVFAREEYEYWKSKPEREIADDKAAFDDSVVPIVDAGLAKFVATDYAIDRNLCLVPSPGHTPYHCSVAIESAGSSAIISGDFLHHPCQIANPAWSTMADFDQDKARETRIALLSKLAETDTVLIGSHFPYPSAGLVVRDHTGAFVFRALDQAS